MRHGNFRAAADPGHAAVTLDGNDARIDLLHAAYLVLFLADGDSGCIRLQGPAEWPLFAAV